MAAYVLRLSSLRCYFIHIPHTGSQPTFRICDRRKFEMTLTTLLISAVYHHEISRINQQNQMIVSVPRDTSLTGSSCKALLHGNLTVTIPSIPTWRTIQGSRFCSWRTMIVSISPFTLPRYTQCRKTMYPIQDIKTRDLLGNTKSSTIDPWVLLSLS